MFQRPDSTERRVTPARMCTCESVLMHPVMSEHGSTALFRRKKVVGSGAQMTCGHSFNLSWCSTTASSCAVGCTHSPCEEIASFHHVPKHIGRKQKWITAINYKYWQPHKYKTMDIVCFCFIFFKILLPGFIIKLQVTSNKSGMSR